MLQSKVDHLLNSLFFFATKAHIWFCFHTACGLSLQSFMWVDNNLFHCALAWLSPQAVLHLPLLLISEHTSFAVLLIHCSFFSFLLCNPFTIPKQGVLSRWSPRQASYHYTHPPPAPGHSASGIMLRK